MENKHTTEQCCECDLVIAEQYHHPNIFYHTDGKIPWIGIGLSNMDHGFGPYALLDIKQIGDFIKTLQNAYERYKANEE